MIAQPKISFTEEQYLHQERHSSIKHEFYAGDIYAMAGASEQHNLISMNIAGILRTHLRGSGCRAYPSDMRLKIANTGLYTYPDFAVVCGQSQFIDTEKRDTILNPILLIEILSASTERYDRGAKFSHYRTIQTLQEYVLIAQDSYHIECFSRQTDDTWLLSEAAGRRSSIELASIKLLLALEEVYEDVPFVVEGRPILPHDQTYP